MKTLRIIILSVTLVILSCEGTTENKSYEQLRDEGINLFTQGKYKKALNQFESAQAETEVVGEINTWIGWANFKLSENDEALSAFDTALSDQDTIIVNLYAGVAFLQNALKSYQSSNDFIDEVRDISSNWVFDYGLNLNQSHLAIIAAQNYFNLGEFASAIDEIHVIDGNFAADISTSEGQAEIAQKIESLLQLL